MMCPWSWLFLSSVVGGIHTPTIGNDLNIKRAEVIFKAIFLKDMFEDICNSSQRPVLISGDYCICSLTA